MRVTREQARIQRDLAEKAETLSLEAKSEVKKLFPRRGNRRDDLDMVRRKIRGSEVMVNFEPGPMQGSETLLADVLFASDHLMNQHETGYGATTNMQKREEFEAGIGYERIRFGTEVEAADKLERPRYGSLNIFTAGAGTWIYGGCAIVLHSDTLRYATLTFRDSISMTWNTPYHFTQALGTREHFDHSITFRHFHYPSDWDEWKTGLIRTARGMSDPALERNVHYYAEVQIHGVVEIPQDILYLRANFYSEFGTPAGSRLQHWARRRGWPLVWGMGHEMVIDPTVEFPKLPDDGNPRPVWTDAIVENAELFADIWSNVAERKRNHPTTSVERAREDWAVLRSATPPAGRYVPGTTETVPVTMSEMQKRIVPMPLEEDT